MHDSLGGSNPTAAIVTNSDVNGQLPFSKANGAVQPFNNGVPQNNRNNGFLNNDNVHFITGLSGTSTQVFQNNGNNFFTSGGVGFPVVNSGQLSSGSGCSVLQGLMFGTMTAIDDELTTERHELGSGLVGKAQGFYMVSSEDGTSQTMAFTAMFESVSYENSLCFFGVHRTGVSESYLAIMGGTGKYANAKGFAGVKSFPAVDQHVELTVYAFWVDLFED